MGDTFIVSIVGFLVSGIIRFQKFNDLGIEGFRDSGIKMIEYLKSLNS
jgi:hypothetical protein